MQLEFDVETFEKYGRTLAYVWGDRVMANFVRCLTDIFVIIRYNATHMSRIPR